GGGNGEIMGGLIGSYAINDQFSVRLGYEGRENNDTVGGGYDTVGLGGTYTTGPWAFAADIYNVDTDGEDDDRTAWALGTYYKVSSNFDVFVELNQADQQSISVNLDGLDSSVENADGDDIYYLTGARYHF
ncbi:porin, partial [Vreelandella venusta]|uniref:porin n=1 Tax=Vreelandella venusta TaxID=44935 RepID=UPI00228655E4